MPLGASIFLCQGITARSAIDETLLLFDERGSLMTASDWLLRTICEDQRRGKDLLAAADRARATGSLHANPAKICDSAAQRAPEAARVIDSLNAMASAQSISRARPFFMRVTLRRDGRESNICLSEVCTASSF
jgi:hypothetical protein